MNIYRVRVYFEDTDCGRIVYHTNYIKYCERARSELFFAQGTQPFMNQSAFVLKKLEADFLASARLGDMLEVRSAIAQFKNVSVVLKQDIYRIYNALKGEECEELIFKAYITLAFVDVERGKPCKIPPSMHKILSKLQE